MLTILPLVATAQEHIENAFADFLKMKGITYSETHSKNSNPETGQRIGMMDAYSFKAAKWNPSLLDQIKKAIRQDSEQAYQEVWAMDEEMQGNVTQRKIMYNEDDGIHIGMEYPNYILICFTDEKQSGFRYAYVVEWGEENGQGRLIKAYAPLPNKKKSSVRAFSIPDISSETFEIPSDFSWPQTSQQMSSSSWLTKFGIYKKSFQDKPKDVTATAFATKIYELCKDCGSLNDTERTMVTEQIEKLIPLTKDDMIQNLFKSAIENLKKPSGHQ